MSAIPLEHGLGRDAPANGQSAIRPSAIPALAPADEPWDTELFVLHGADRPQLRQQAESLLAFLERHDGVVLKDLAFTLNRALPTGGCRLALVAGNVADLRARLKQAAGRLAEPGCRQIRDAVGIYYFDQPLYPSGRVALLFPGEGAQYRNMLYDLCRHFPVVRDHFARGDELMRQGAGDRLPLSELLFVPADASPERVAEAERRLRQLDSAMFSVILADSAVHQLVRALEVPTGAVAGHSMGELVALSAAGCVDQTTLLLGRVLDAMDTLRRQEEDGVAADAVLLAVGAGRKVVADAVGPQAGTDVYVAMDNCPHQTVVVGRPAAMARVEADLQARGILCERLPFRRPYHTPLFEPFLGPLDRMFDGTRFRAPQMPVYSCTTARPFPTEPAAIRQLAVAHWAAPVQFTQLIENLYADGVRLFVECGPRGNLSAFVEDILRGRPFAALPADVPRRTGIAQLNHLAAQLAAHHVPLRLEYLYERRNPAVVDCGLEKESAARTPQSAIRNGPAGRGAVLTQYWDVMEQFLDVQREVMEGFLARRRSAPVSRNGHAAPAKTPPAEAPRRLPLIGDIVRHEPGQELVMRRRLDRQEDQYANDHAVGGVNISRVDPTQRGLPVMPMTGTLELMAEVAALLLPGLVVTALRGIRLFHWLPFLDDPITVEVTARVQAPDGGPRRVNVEVRDRGSASQAKAEPTSAARATVVLDTHYPAAPAAEPFALTGERPSPISLETLYNNLFHGPLFQGVVANERHGEEGIESEVRVLSRSGLFRSDPEPAWLLDPVLLDVAMHPLAAWHIAQPDQSGRIVLPFAVESLEMFGPAPPVGSRFRARGRNRATTARQFHHDVEVIGADGRLWCRMTAAKYWRFYLPFGRFNFHGPKDEYFLCEDWPQALPPTADGARAWCVRLVLPPDLRQPLMREAAARVALTPAELQQFRDLPGPEASLNAWLFGRIAAKDALRLLWRETHGEKLFPADIEVECDARGRLVARRRGQSTAGEFPLIAGAFGDGCVVGLAAFRPFVGIAVAKVGTASEEALTADERQLLGDCGPDRAEWATRFACARDAVAQALGGTCDLAMRKVDATTGRLWLVLGPSGQAAFPEVGSALLTVRTVRENDWVVATTFCEKESP